MGRALVIDDQPNMRRLITKILTGMGHEVIEADNGLDGLARYKEHHPELVVTDIIMPGMEGIETIMQLRRLSSDLKIIAVSGVGDGGSGLYLNAARKLGAHRIVPKPFRAADLENAVEALMPSAA